MTRTDLASFAELLQAKQAEVARGMRGLDSRSPGQSIAHFENAVPHRLRNNGRCSKGGAQAGLNWVVVLAG